MLTGDLRTQLSRALDAKYAVSSAAGPAGPAPWLIDVDPAARVVLAEIKTGETWTTCRLGYALEDDGAVLLDEAVEPVLTGEAPVLKGTSTLVASRVDDSPAQALIAELVAGNPAYAGVCGTPNGSPFVIDLTLLDIPSQHAGATRFVLKASGAEAAMATLAGKPVHITSNLTGHFEAGRPWTPVGVMLGGKVIANGPGTPPVVRAAGLLWDNDFPEQIKKIRATKALLGASWEIEYPTAQATRVDGNTIELNAWVYSGAAILLKTSAAYPDTAVLHASDEGAEAAELTFKERSKLKDDDFAVVIKTDRGFPIRKLPIHDEAHRKAAWTRVNQSGTDLTDAQRSEAKDKIINRAKKAGDGWAKAYTKKGGEWVKGPAPAKKGKAMAGKFAGYKLPDEIDESVIEQIVADAIATQEAGKGAERLKGELTTAQAEAAALKETLKEAQTAGAAKLQETEARAVAAETQVVELTTQLEAATEELDTFKAEKATAEAEALAKTWWVTHAQANHLTHLAQAEVDKRWPLILRAAQDEPLKPGEWAQLNQGARVATKPAQRGGGDQMIDVPLMAGAGGITEVPSRDALGKMFPSLGRTMAAEAKRANR